MSSSGNTAGETASGSADRATPFSATPAGIVFLVVFIPMVVLGFAAWLVCLGKVAVGAYKEHYRGSQHCGRGTVSGSTTPGNPHGLTAASPSRPRNWFHRRISGGNQPQPEEQSNPVAEEPKPQVAGELDSETRSYESHVRNAASKPVVGRPVPRSNARGRRRSNALLMGKPRGMQGRDH